VTPFANRGTSYRRATAVLLLAFVLAPALNASADAASIPGLHRYSLDNGLRVWHRTRTESDSVSICLSVGVGARDETRDNNGITHFLEHLAFAGSERYDRAEMTEMLRSRGGVQNAVTTEERTIFYAQIASEHFELALDWLSQVVFHPTLPAARVDEERNVVLEEKGGKTGLLRSALGGLGFEYNLGLELRRSLFPDSGLALPIIGRDRSLASVCHDDLVRHHAAYYTTGNTVLVIAGNVTPERAEKACLDYFADLAPGGRAPSCAALNPLAEPPAAVTLRGLSFTSQCTLALAARTCPAKHPDRWPLEVLGELLQRNLMEEGRYHRALAYEIAADNTFFSDTGCFTLFTRARRGNLKELRRLMDEEIERVRKGEVDAGRLAEAQEALRGRWALAMETNANQMAWLERLARDHSDEEPLPDYAACVRAVTAEDLARVVNTYFVAERMTVGRHVPML